MDFNIVSEDESPVDFQVCSIAGCSEPVAVWGGRGRRPTKCDEHRKTKSPLGTKSTGSNKRKATVAAAILVQWNSLAAFGLFVSGYPGTHDAISGAQPSFQSSAELALESNPELCDTIIRLGKNSGQAGLFLVYGQMLAVVGPTLLMEHKLKVAERKAREEEETE